MKLTRCFIAVTTLAVLLAVDVASFAHPAPAPVPAQDDQAALIPADQLDSLVAPIALYPDPLLSQVLVASTYPLELMQLQQWLGRNQGLKDKALVGRTRDLREPQLAAGFGLCKLEGTSAAAQTRTLIAHPPPAARPGRRSGSPAPA